MSTTVQRGSSSATRSTDKQQISLSGDVHEKQAPLGLTLGVEIECILIWDHAIWDYAKFQTYEGNPQRFARESMLSALEHPMPAKCDLCGQIRNLVLPVKEAADTDDDPDHWNIKSDPDVDLSGTFEDFQGDPYSVMWHPFEITSRVLGDSRNMRLKQWPGDVCPHSINYQKEIKLVMNRLREGFSNTGPQRGWKLIVNESCGLHVHVGNGDKSFPLQTVKNLMFLHLAAERAIDSMHAGDRIQGSKLAFDQNLDLRITPMWNHNLFNGTNRPWSMRLAMLKYGYDKPPEYTKRTNDMYPEKHYQAQPDLRQAATSNNIPASLKVVDGADDIGDLQDMARTKWVTANLLNLEDYNAAGSSRKKGTIEFRQQTGTLDTREILAFIDVLVAMVQWSHHNTRTHVHQTCTNIWQDPKFELLHLLQLLNFDKKRDTFKHYKSFAGLRKHGSESAYALKYYARHARYTPSNTDVVQELANCTVQRGMQWRHPGQARNRIQEKFLAGCYGQYEQELLDDLAGKDDDWPSAFGKGRLVLGWGP